MLNNVKIFHIKRIQRRDFVTLSKNKTVELTKSIFSLIFIYIGIEFLAAIILIPFAIVLDLIFKVNLLGNQYDSIF